jgi:hypothetical protein
LYKINKISTLKKFVLRGNYLTNKVLKKTSKQTLIFLRAPKHFNIGKRKVSSFVNYKKFVYNFNLNLPTDEYNKNGKTFFRFFCLFHKLNFLYVVNSVRITSKLKIK